MKKLVTLTLLGSLFATVIAWTSAEARFSTPEAAQDARAAKPASTHVARLIGLTIPEALEVTNLAVCLSSGWCEGCVITTQDPAPGTPIGNHERIDVTFQSMPRSLNSGDDGSTLALASLSTGVLASTPPPTHVPNIVGLPLGDAKDALDGLPLVVENPPASVRAIVIQQDPAAGTELDDPLPAGFYVGVIISQVPRSL